MGRFMYGATGTVQIEDRILAHLRIVVMHKLRRSEPFMLDVDSEDGGGRRSFWIHPAVAMQFHFFGVNHLRVDRAWIEEMIIASGRPQGLTLMAEPLESLASAAEPASPETSSFRLS